MAQYPIVLDNDELYGGLACLATIAKYYRRNFPLDRICQIVVANQPGMTLTEGTTLLALKRGAEALGFKAVPVKTSYQVLDQLNKIQMPAIILLNNYWAVLYGENTNQYVIGNTCEGIQYLSKEELVKSWTNGVMLLLEPRSIFKGHNNSLKILLVFASAFLVRLIFQLLEGLLKGR